jgi:hypothetical protein
MAVVRPEQPEDKYMHETHDALVEKVIQLPDTFLYLGEKKPTDHNLDEWPVSTLALWLAQHEVENPHLHVDD